MVVVVVVVLVVEIVVVAVVVVVVVAVVVVVVVAAAVAVVAVRPCSKDYTLVLASVVASQYCNRRSPLLKYASTVAVPSNCSVLLVARQEECCTVEQCGGAGLVIALHRVAVAMWNQYASTVF
eukprot:1556053-Pyramimonas_sp.AAC.1